MNIAVSGRILTSATPLLQTPMIPSVGVFLRFVAAVFREIAVLAASPVKLSRGYAAYIRYELFEI